MPVIPVSASITHSTWKVKFPFMQHAFSHSDTLDAVSGRQQMAELLADPFFAEALFDQLTDVVFFVKNTHGCYIVVNHTLMQRCGCQHKSELIGRSPLDVFPSGLAGSYASQDQYVIRHGQAIHNQLELHLYINQTPVWCLTHKIPLFDRAGAIAGLAGISRDLHMPDKNHPVYQRIADVVAYIQQHYAEQLRLEYLAQIAHLSAAQLERYMQRIFQLTPKQFIMKTRIEAATYLLGQDQTISAIAFACGYADHSAFSRQFKAAVGLSPVAYRKLHHKLLHTQNTC
jgi:AraC-like DNA-binding protein